MKLNYRILVAALMFFSASAQAQNANMNPDTCGPPPPSINTCGPPSTATVPCMEKALQQDREYAVCRLNAIRDRALLMQPQLSGVQSAGSASTGAILGGGEQK